MKLLRTIFSDTVHLFYPHLCTGCGSDLLHEKNLLCIKCISTLPHTGFAFHAGNPAEKMFWGRLPVSAAHSEFFFSKNSVMQQLIHELKYKNNKAIGFYLGELIGKSLLNSNRFMTIDVLIPLPLFADREKQRGYNQATILCEGISSITQIPVDTKSVIRQYHTATQTHKHRDERWQNVDGSFIVKHPSSLEGKHLLLVDDVVTTGATIEAFGNAIISAANVDLSIATLALAPK
jgi:ComF family protein